MSHELPVACALTSPELRARRNAILALLRARGTRRERLADRPDVVPGRP